MVLVSSLSAILASASPAAADVDVVYREGDILFVVDHDRATEAQVIAAYGMALHLAARGVRVDWWIAADKAYEGYDFTALTDAAPDPATPGPDGAVATRSYRAGPFVVPDPDRSTTSTNEAWAHIAALRTMLGLSPLIHEIRSAPSGPRLNAGFLTFLPRIAYSNNAGIADDEVALAMLPAVDVRAPGTVGNPATVAGGGLFEGDASDPCGLSPRYDVFLQDHYDWTTPNAEELAAMRNGFDPFLRAGTTCIFECESATVDDTLHWLTEPGNVATEGNTGLASYTVVPDLADHPFAQTMGSVPVVGGAFSLWSRTANNFRSTRQNIFYAADTGDIGYCFGQVGGGKFFFAGGHRRAGLSDRRLILNAVLYEAVSPQFGRRLIPATLGVGAPARRRVEITLRGGSLALGTVLTDTLAPGVSLVPGSVRVHAAGGTHVWDPGARRLTFTLGDVDPDRFGTRPIADYEIETTASAPGYVRLLDSTAAFGDAWTTGIAFSGGACVSAYAPPILAIDKRVDRTPLFTGANNVVLTIEVRNNGGSLLYDVEVADALPSGVVYVGPLDTHGRGVADWGVTVPGRLTWSVGVLAPGESASIDIPVRASPTAVGTFLLNDGPTAGALDAGGTSYAATAANLTVPVVTGGPNIVFDLAPDVVPPGAVAAFTLQVRNAGARTDQQVGDVVEIEFPDAWGTPRSIVPPAGWIWTWDALHGRLVFSHPRTTVRFDVAAFTFGFTLTAPSAPGAFFFPARVTFSDVPRNFDADLPVTVRWSTLPDADGDGVPDADEVRLGLDPADPDTDGDGIPDGVEVGNPAAPYDSDGDTVIDALELDADGDGLPDAVEGTNDTDGDGVPDFRDRDDDGDGAYTRDERLAGTDPLDPDTDGDCVPDGLEPRWNEDTDGDTLINALDYDSDNDDLRDGLELGYCGDADPYTTTDPLDPDTDGDGLDDGEEDLDGNGAVDPGETDPLNPDTDRGGTDDGTEIADGTDPLDPSDDLDGDADGDGLSGRVERAAGTDPNDPDTDDDCLRDGDEPRWNQDTDGDTLINALDTDSDDDMLPDGLELSYCGDADPSTSTDPLDPDTDGGGVSDGLEDADRNGAVDPGETDPRDPTDDFPPGADADADGDADADADTDADIDIPDVDTDVPGDAGDGGVADGDLDVPGDGSEPDGDLDVPGDGSEPDGDLDVPGDGGEPDGGLDVPGDGSEPDGGLDVPGDGSEPDGDLDVPGDGGDADVANDAPPGDGGGDIPADGEAPPVVGGGGGCGCRSAGGSATPGASAGVLLGLLALAHGRRRRRKWDR
jgi:uncharacterized repeat protein (TIGR01451 family)/MYXO-CTERM domain-containing protein